MRSRNFVFIASLLISFIAGHITATNQAHAVTAERAIMVSDEKTGALRFLIDGKEAARIDTNGLHVRQNIEYGGYEMDYGQIGYDRYVAEVRNAK